MKRKPQTFTSHPVGFSVPFLSGAFFSYPFKCLGRALLMSFWVQFKSVCERKSDQCLLFLSPLLLVSKIICITFH